jgi:DNA-binding transcriptional LysR family regulator
MSKKPGVPTLDQLLVFLAVVEAGSFAGAARKLGRATSVISYSIANLEAQLLVSLFDRESTKKPQLTQAGLAVLAEARTVSHSISDLRAKVTGLLQGLESEVHMVIDVMLPAARLTDALTTFRTEFPTVMLYLHVEALGAVTKMVLDGGASIGITGPLDLAIDGMERVGVGSVALIPVAAPGHALAQRKNKPGDSRDHIQLVLTDRSALTQGRDFGVVGTRTWRLADLGAKLMLLKAGVGWGAMPVPMIQDDLNAGRLVRLDVPDFSGGDYALQVIYRTDTPPGPAGSWLISRFQHQSERSANSADIVRSVGRRTLPAPDSINRRKT